MIFAFNIYIALFLLYWRKANANISQNSETFVLPKGVGVNQEHFYEKIADLGLDHLVP